MRVGVVSDSHGEIENLQKATRWLIEDQNVEVVVHLADWLLQLSDQLGKLKRKMKLSITLN